MTLKISLKNGNIFNSCTAKIYFSKKQGEKKTFTGAMNWVVKHMTKF